MHDTDRRRVAAIAGLVSALLLGLAILGGGAEWHMKLVYAASSLVTYLAGLAAWRAGRPLLFGAVLLAGAVGFVAGTSALAVKASFADAPPFLYVAWMLFFGCLCIATRKAAHLLGRFFPTPGARQAGLKGSAGVGR